MNQCQILSHMSTYEIYITEINKVFTIHKNTYPPKFFFFHNLLSVLHIQSKTRKLFLILFCNNSTITDLAQVYILKYENYVMEKLYSKRMNISVAQIVIHV